ncbi:sensor histidine kinase [Parafilimonas terrae]|uniref:histidine kinase n=1 Tax=Parafilimonas terrae TaxID=1465490 RepID=A0A1I5XYQ8_9BACT|nr:ATP-binding protein [Parafilimonas terrae]SFQ37044.1 Signal transduction histidine kinase [Parafilimonas terrae]
MLSYYITIFGAGALCLAAVYQTILYFNKRDSLLLRYGVYLWSVFLFLCYRLVFGIGVQYHTHHFDFLNITIASDHTLLMITYIAYAIFWKQSLQLQKKDGRFIWYYYKSIAPVILIYIIWENITSNINVGFVEMIFYIIIRIYLAVFTFTTTIYTLKLRNNIYYVYLACGTISIILSGLFSTYVQLCLNGSLFTLNAFSWMIFGYFFETIFFSAAIGYKLKQETIEKIKALRKVLEQQKIIQAKDLEKAEAAYKAREDERSRIATELHDDLGSGLSTIRILAETTRANIDHVHGMYLEKISRQSKELLQNMGEIIWTLNTNNDTLENLIAYFRQHTAKTLNNANILYNFHIAETIPPVKISGANRRHILLLIKEALHNILKHAEATRVEIYISVSQEFRITIKDNGKGIPEKYIADSNGNGLRNMHKHANAVRGSIHITNHNGTVINFEAPVTSLSHESVI